MAFKVFTFTGIVSPGVITVDGLKVGDQIISILRSPDGAVIGTNNFGSFIITNNELLQTSASDLSADTLKILVQREIIF